MTRRARAGADPHTAWQALAKGVQAGLERLVSDNEKLVRAMLEADTSSDTTDLCRRCAGVMRQQKLSASAFLARFFQADVLADHAMLLGKSSKGGAAALAERVAAAWSKGPDFQAETGGEVGDEGYSTPKRRKVLAKGPEAFLLTIKTAEDSEEHLYLLPTAEALACRAWKLSQDSDLTLFDGEWGVQLDGGCKHNCYDVMVSHEDLTSDSDDDGETDFKDYVENMLMSGKKSIKITDGDGQAIIMERCV